VQRARLEEFRQAAYTYLGKGHDATFEGFYPSAYRITVTAVPDWQLPS